MQAPRNTYIGTSPLRREDPTLLRGAACFSADAPLQDPLHLVFLRSTIAHGEITSLDLAPALDISGVIAAHSAPDVSHLGKLSVNAILPIETDLPYPILAGPKIQAIGQHIAAVLAKSRAAAQDGCEAIQIETKDHPAPNPASVAKQSWTQGDPNQAFQDAAHVVSVKITHPRLAPASMEPRTISITYDQTTDRATIYHSTQTPHRTRSEAAGMLGIDPNRIRVISTWVGGAFGMKASLHPEEVFAIWAAFQHRRDVTWTATRSEEFLSGLHGRAITTEGQLALAEDGRFLALKAQVTCPLGPWLPNSGLIPAFNAARILPGGYNIPHLYLTTDAQSHALPATGIYRGAGRPEAAMLLERLVEEAAQALRQDSMMLRLKNLLPPGRLPHRIVSGHELCSGDYPALLTQLAEQADLPALNTRRDAMRQEGRLAGVGIAFYLEPSGEGWESATVTLNADGTAEVASGSSSQGHGRETAYAQITADALGLTLNQITVRAGDTETCPEGIGAVASRSTAIGGSAVLEACQEIAARRGAGDALPLTATTRYSNQGQAWSAGAYVCLIEIDSDTGGPTVHAVNALDDTGRTLNPMMAKGQITGGFAQGFGEAFLEEIAIDESGQVLSGSFMDYAMPRADDVPKLDLDTVSHITPTNTLGAKGIGEAGTIGAPAAFVNGVLDALRPAGVTDISMPMTPAKIWAALTAARKGRPT